LDFLFFIFGATTGFAVSDGMPVDSQGLSNGS